MELSKSYGKCVVSKCKCVFGNKIVRVIPTNSLRTSQSYCE